MVGLHTENQSYAVWFAASDAERAFLKDAKVVLRTCVLGSLTGERQQLVQASFLQTDGSLKERFLFGPALHRG